MPLGIRFTATLLVCLLAFGSVTAALAAPGNYTVRRGDNLTHIAGRYGVTVSQLKSANSLRSDVIHVGQKLKIDRPFSRRSSRGISWLKPCERLGRVLRPFGQYKRKGILMPRTGAEVACPVGSRVRAPADGIVRHLGPLDGFGTLVILEHADGYATVLAPLDDKTLQSKVGDAVRRGDVIGRSAAPENDETPYLHVELRRKDKAVKPDRLLR